MRRLFQIRAVKAPIPEMAREKRHAIEDFAEEFGLDRRDMMRDGYLPGAINDYKLVALDAYLQDKIGEGLTAQDFVCHETGRGINHARGAESALLYGPHSNKDKMRKGFLRSGFSVNVLPSAEESGGTEQIFPIYYHNLFEFLLSKDTWFTAEQLMTPTCYGRAQPYPAMAYVMEYGGADILFKPRYWAGHMDELEKLGRMMKKAMWPKDEGFDAPFAALVAGIRNFQEVHPALEPTEV